MLFRRSPHISCIFVRERRFFRHFPPRYPSFLPLARLNFYRRKNNIVPKYGIPRVFLKASYSSSFAHETSKNKTNYLELFSRPPVLNSKCTLVAVFGPSQRWMATSLTRLGTRGRKIIDCIVVRIIIDFTRSQLETFYFRHTDLLSNRVRLNILTRLVKLPISFYA